MNSSEEKANKASVLDDQTTNELTLPADYPIYRSSSPIPAGVGSVHNKVSIASITSLGLEAAPEIPPAISGYLLKQGHVIASWRKRYFTLSEGL